MHIETSGWECHFECQTDRLQSCTAARVLRIKSREVMSTSISEHTTLDMIISSSSEAGVRPYLPVPSQTRCN